MIKVMIVDDERIIRFGISSMIKWSTLGLELVGEASDGEMGYEIFKEKQPDIVITDIKMPRIDGISMIRKIKKDNPQVRFVILSGHEDFAYAKEAIHLGVSEYLLKSDLMPEDIEEILKRIVKEINHEGKPSTTEYRQSQKGSHAQLIGELCQGTRVLNDELRVYLPAFDNGYCCLCAGIKDDGTEAFESMRKKYNLELEQAMQHDFAPYQIITFLAGNQLGAVLFYQREKERELNEALQAFIIRTEHANGLVLTIGRSRYHTKAEALPEMYESAEKSYNQRIFYGCGTIIKVTRGNVNPEKGRKSYNISKLERLVEYHKQDEIITFLTALFDDLKERRNYEEVHLVSMELLVLMNRITGGFLTEEELFERKKESYQQFVRWEMIEDLLAWFSEQFALLLKESRNHSGDTQEVVPYIKAYIEEHYEGDITIQSLSERVHLNKNYLGNLFKKETGKSIGEYIVEVRLSAARQLMIHTDLKANVIAKKVGYEDERYFYKVFKKYTGITTADYIKQFRL